MKKKVFVFVCIILFSFSFIFNFYQQKTIKDKNNELSKNEEVIQQLENKIKKQQDKIETLEFELKPTEKHPIETEEENCINTCAGHFSSICMAECNKKTIPKWDMEAEKNIEKLKTQLSKTDYIKLIEAEKHWQIYKNIQTELIGKNIENKTGLDNLVFAASGVAQISEDHARSLYYLWFFSDDENIFTSQN